MYAGLKKLLTAALALAVLLSLPAVAYADESTTTIDTAYKDLSPNTEIYLVTDAPNTSYPYFGAKSEPNGGVYYGRIAMGGTLPNGRYGLVNASELADESVFSFYYALDNAYSLKYWSYLYGSLLDDHVFQVNLNFEHEAADCTAVLNGSYDAKLIETFKYLGTLSCPILVRIGGEVNCWTNMPDADTFIAAYRHIADIARTYAPDAALMYAPNYSSAYKIDLESFYPGDSYVDWIGVSLYFNKVSTNGDTSIDAFYGVGAYGDALLNVQQTINLARKHSKPVSMTEGGSLYYVNGSDYSDFAAERIEKAYAFLTMVYPEIKSIVYSDSNFGSSSRLYAISGNAKMTEAYNKGVSSNPTLLHSLNESPSYYTKLSDYGTKWEGSVKLAAYTYSDSRITASWYVDGELKANTSDYPFNFTVDTSALSDGKHAVTVKFSNGAEKSYAFTVGDFIENPFTDVPDGMYYTAPVLWAVSKNITTGTSAVTFSPDLNCVKAQIITFLWRAAGSPAPGSAYCPITDISPSEYYYNAVLWAYERGIITGTAFGPDDPCTRGTAVEYMWKAAGSPSADKSLLKFTDVPIQYEDAVAWAVSSKVTTGTSETTFSPDLICTRGQIVTFLSRAYN